MLGVYSIYIVFLMLVAFFFIWLLLNKEKAIDLLKPHETGSIIGIFRITMNVNTQIKLLPDKMW